MTKWTTIRKDNREVHFYQNEKGECSINTDGHYWHWMSVSKDDGNALYREYLKLGYKKI